MSLNQYVIAGDIGGTKVLLELSEATPAGARVLHRQRFMSADYTDFGALVRDFLRTLPPGARPSAACFGVAGPIASDDAGQRAKLTNLPWQIATREIADMTGIGKVALINDWRATGYATESLREEDRVVLQAGTPDPHGVRAFIGAGTGLGEGIASWCHDHYEVLPSEGGHSDFAPTDELQMELWRYLKRTFTSISYERLLCGAGLVRIYTFLRERGSVPETPDLKSKMSRNDPAAAISQAGLTGHDALAAQALDLFVTIYGAQAGNLAVTTLAYGGLFIAGGIAPKIIDKMIDGHFMRAFCTKGRMSPLMEQIPVYVVTNQDIGLRGAAVAASRL